MTFGFWKHEQGGTLVQVNLWAKGGSHRWPNRQIRFDDGAAYERMMGIWSRLAGEIFLDWLAPRPGLRWIDVGCGNGAFTELLVERCAPAEVQGIDPSEAQLAFARARPAARVANFARATLWRFPSLQTGSMQPLWRW